MLMMVKMMLMMMTITDSAVMVIVLSMVIMIRMVMIMMKSPIMLCWRWGWWRCWNFKSDFLSFGFYDFESYLLLQYIGDLVQTWHECYAIGWLKRRLDSAWLAPLTPISGPLSVNIKTDSTPNVEGLPKKLIILLKMMLWVIIAGLPLHTGHHSRVSGFKVIWE